MPATAKIRGFERKDGRPKRWGISIPRVGKSAKRVFFQTKSERDGELVALQRIASTEGTSGLVMSSADARMVAELREMLPSNVDPREAVRFYLDHHTQRSERSLKDATRDYLYMMQVRRLSPEYRAHMETELGRLAACVGEGVDIGSISATDIAKFFAALPLAPRTKENYREHYARFFAWCIKSGFCLHSPMDAMDSIKVAETDPNVMPLEDVRAFFAECMKSNPRVAPFMALAFFAGLRSSQIPRLKLGDFNFEERGITMPGATHKTLKRFYVEGHEDNLWEWLEPLRKIKASWRPFADSTFRDWREKIYLRAGIEYPHNGARDSFCSYHIALHNDASRTATLLTHRGVNMLYGHYRGKAMKKDAVAYFTVVPGG